MLKGLASVMPRLTPEEYKALVVKQEGVCAICGSHQRYQKLAIDHCHKTGKVRGLLCMQCNRGIGRFFDSPARLRKAAEYLERVRPA